MTHRQLFFIITDYYFSKIFFQAQILSYKKQNEISIMTQLDSKILPPGTDKFQEIKLSFQNTISHALIIPIDII